MAHITTLTRAYNDLYNSQANTYSYSGSFETFKESEVKVKLNDTLLTYNSSPSDATQYSVNLTDKTIHVGGGNLTSGTLSIYPETDLGAPTLKAPYTAGSAVTANDLTNNQKQTMRKLMEHEETKLNNTGGTMTGDLTIGEDRNIIFEGATDDGYETTITVADPTADRTITFPDKTGNVVTTGDTGTVTSTMITNDTIVDADVNTSAAIAGTKISPNFGGQSIVTTGAATIGSTLAVTGAVDLNGGASIDNIQIGVTGDNEIDTASGNLTIDSAGGTTTIDDALAVTGGVSLDTTLGVTGTSTLSNITGGAVVTSGTSTSDTKVYSAKRVGEIFYGKDTVEEIQSGELWSAADDKVATTAAIDARIIDLVDDVGGFVPIANELSFPNANPDVNNGAGTLVSIKALSTAYTSNGSGEITINNGTVGNSTVTITGAGANVTYAQTLGIIVETTTTLNTYAFHRQTPDATSTTAVANNATNINKVAAIDSNVTTVAGIDSDVTTVAGKATEIGRLGTAAAVEDMSILGTTDVVADMAILGTTDVVADMAILGTTDVVADMAILATNDVVADLNTLGTSAIVTDMDALADVATEIGRLGTADAVADMNTLGTADIVSDMNILGTSANVTAMSNCSGSITNINTVASNLNTVNDFAARYDSGPNNPINNLDTGDLFFNTTSNSLKVYTGSAWVDGVTTTGNFALKTGNTFTGSNVYNDNVKALFGTGSDLEVYHDGNHSRIVSNTGNFFIQTDAFRLRSQDSSDLLIAADKDSGVDLYFNNSKKFETTSTGIDVDGTVTANDIITAGALLHEGDSDTLVHFSADNTIDLKTGGSSRLTVTNNGLALQNGYFTSNGNRIILGDSSGATVNRIIFGNNDDLQIYHDGSNSYIEDSGTGSLILKSNHLIANAGAYSFMNAANSETLIYAVENGAVQLYHDNSKKLETASDGILASGAIRTNAATSGAASANQATFDFNSQNARLLSYHSSGSSISAFTNPNGGSLTERFRIEAGGDIKVTGDKAIFFGAGDDLMVGHDGTSTRIEDSYGYLTIKSNALELRSNTGSELYIKNTVNGAVELYHDNSRKLFTTSVGAQVTDNFSITDTGGNQRLLMGNQDSAGANCPKILNSGNGTLRIGIGDSWSGDGGTLTEQLNITKDGNVQIPADNKELQLGAGDDLKIFHDGTNTNIRNQTGDLYIRSSGVRITNDGVTEHMAKFFADGAVELYFNNSKKLHTKSGGIYVTGDIETSGDIYMLDNERLRIGTGQDLEIKHDGSNSIIDNNTGELKIQSDNFRFLSSDGTEYFADFNVNGNVELYYDNSKKFETTSNGVEVHGDVNIPNDSGKLKLGTGQDLQIYHDGNNSVIDNDTGNLYVQSSGSILIQGANNENVIKYNANGAVELYHDDSKKLETLTDGIDVDGSITCNDLITAGAVLHEGDTNTLMHFDSNDNIAFKTNGTVRARINNSGLCFNADTSSDNALSDYEEGAWTPTVSFGGGTSGISYSYNAGRYVKIGKMIHIQCYVAFSAKGSSNGTAKIGGLPFTTRNQSQMYASAAIGYFHNWTSASGPGGISQAIAYAEINDTVINMQRQEMGNSGTGVNDMTDSNFSDSSDFMLTMTYITN